MAGIYAKSTRNRKFFKRRPKKGARRYRRGLATKRDLYLLSKQVKNTREVKQAFAVQDFEFGSYKAPNEGISDTYATRSLAIDGTYNAITIPQNTTASGRIGSDIRIKKVELKMNFIVLPAQPGNVTPKPQIVKIFFGYSKPMASRSRQNLPPNAALFYKLGNVAVNPTGTVEDLTRSGSINTDLYTIVKRTRNIKLGASAYFQSNTNFQDWNNNDFSLFKSMSFDLTKHYPKNQSFYGTEAGSVQRGLYMYVTSVNCDGTTTSSTPLKCSYELKVSYTDA